MVDEVLDTLSIHSLQTQWDFPTIDMHSAHTGLDAVRPCSQVAQVFSDSGDLPHSDAQQAALKKKKCRPGKKRRDRKREGEQRQLADAIPEEVCFDEHVADSSTHDSSNCFDTASTMKSKSEIGTEWCDDPSDPLVLSESEDGKHLRVGMYNGSGGISEQLLSRSGEREHMHSDQNWMSHPLVKLWLAGHALAKIVQFERGRAGRTPTIIPGGLAEVQDLAGTLMLEVKFEKHGIYTYRRGFGNGMPIETAADSSRRPLRWFQKHRTYGSPGLDAPIPNRVAEWLEGKNLTPLVLPPHIGSVAIGAPYRWASHSWKSLSMLFGKVISTCGIATGAVVSSIVLLCLLRYPRNKHTF